MSEANPTALKLGMQGMLDGRRFTVKGRVVLSMEADDGETYYWNEFNIMDTAGRAVTLVFEETEQGPTWKWFMLFEPRVPLTAAEAAKKCRGDTVNFEGRPIHITLVDETRVEYIEGEVPEGVEVGDRASYFNADAGDRVLVASWTGDEIEFYQGVDLPKGRVEQAFGLPKASGVSGFDGDDVNWSEWGSYLRFGGFVLAAAIMFFSRTCHSNEPEPYRVPEPAAKQMAPAAFLPLSVHGRLVNHDYTIVGRALLEVARVGKRFDRYEYALRDQSGSPALLVNSLGGDLHEWHWLVPVEAPPGFTPYAAAALRQGRLATFGGRSMQVTQLFLGKVQSMAGPNAAGLWAVELHYGLIARLKDEWLVARWTEKGLQFYEGKSLAESEVLQAFGTSK